MQKYIDSWVKSIDKHQTIWLGIYTMFWLGIGIVCGMCM